MIKNTGILFLLMWMVQSIAASAQTIGTGNYHSGFEKNGNEINFNTTNGKVKLIFNTPDMFRLRASWDGEFQPNEPYMVVDYDWPAVDIHLRQSGGYI